MLTDTIYDPVEQAFQPLLRIWKADNGSLKQIYESSPEDDPAIEQLLDLISPDPLWDILKKEPQGPPFPLQSYESAEIGSLLFIDGVTLQLTCPAPVVGKTTSRWLKGFEFADFKLGDSDCTFRYAPVSKMSF